MVRVEFRASPFGPATAIEVAAGERLMDACDAAGAAVPFSCRNASCGTCLVRIERGDELLDPIAAGERTVLEALEAAPACRLACRARIVSDHGIVAVAMETIGRAGQM
jgi:ferredoxin